MILHSEWEPTPPRPGSLDDCQARGFDPASVEADRARPEPLDDEWQAALDGAIDEARHLRCGVVDCGEIRCDRCDERMTCLGPEPRICGTTCADCPCDCTGCLQVREEMRADLLHRIERESR